MRKVAVISGSSRGLGRALAFAFGAAGYRLVVNGRGAERLDGTRRELARQGYEVLAVAADVATAAGAGSLARQAVARFGRIDVLVNNAGVLGPGGRPTLASVAPNAVLDALAVNVGGPLRLTQAALPALRASEGAVINVTSDAAIGGYPGWGAYGAGKAALELITRSWAAEEEHVRFHSVDPGDLQTDMQREAFPGEDVSDRLDPSLVTAPFVWLAEAVETGLRIEAATWISQRLAS